MIGIFREKKANLNSVFCKTKPIYEKVKLV